MALSHEQLGPTMRCQQKSKYETLPGQNFFVHFAMRYPVLRDERV